MIKTANQISMIYIIVGITWIFVSDRIDVGSNWIYYQTFKGIGYVICTGILLWLVIRRKERKNEVIRENLEASLQKIKQAEQRLKDKGSLLRTVIDNLPDHIFVKDLQGKVMIGNAALVKTFGFDSENDLLGKDIRELIPNDQGVRFFEDDFRVMQTDTKLLNQEEVLINQSGKMQRILTTKVPLHDEQQNVIGLVGVSRDVTALYLKRIKDDLGYKIIDALHANDNLDAALVESLRIIGEYFHFAFAEAWLPSPAADEIDLAVTWSIDKESDFHKNHRTNYKSGQGLPGRALLSKAVEIWPDVMQHPDFIRKDQAAGESLKTGIAIPLILNNQVIAVFSFLSKEKFDDHYELRELLQHISVQIVMHLERKKHESELLESSRSISNILESISEGFFAIADDWTVTYWNTEAEKLLDVPRNLIVGHKLWELFPEDSIVRSSSFAHYRQVMLDKKAVVFEEFYKSKDVWLEISVYPSQNGISVFLRNISENRRLSNELNKRVEELGASNAELEQFAYIASHDLQEPLRMVTGFLTQLQKKYDGQLDEKAQQYIHFAVDGAVRMRKIILDLLEYSRIGKYEVQLETVDINDVVDSVLIMNKTLIEEEAVTFKRDDLPSVFGAKTSLQQVFHNLIINAIRYRDSGRNPIIGITADEDEHYWKFAVSDNGIGIKRDFYDKVFVLFQRLHNRGEYSGTGIGLAICKKIIENHGGRIWIESEEGIGSTFYFTIKK